MPVFAHTHASNKLREKKPHEDCVVSAVLHSLKPHLLGCDVGLLDVIDYI